MTEIRVSSPIVAKEDITVNSSIQLRGFATDGGGTPPDPSIFYGCDQAAVNMEKRERTNSRVSIPVSVKSEPDVDTIMPLPIMGGFYNRGYQHECMEESPDISDEENGVIYNVHNNQTASFTTVEHPTMIGNGIFGDDLTAKALETCKRTVLQPYLVFLKVIGWRSFRPRCYDLRSPSWLVALNIIWPIFACLLLVASCITQISMCFRRDTVTVSTKKLIIDNETNLTVYEVSCGRHILTTFIVPDILLLLSFTYGLYIFRWVQTEQLSTLTEAVFLGQTRHGRYSHKRLTKTLQLLISLGMCWIIFSVLASVGRAYTLHLVDRKTKIMWLPSSTETEYSIRWIFVSITVVGFVLLDLAYMAVVVNYCIQCQLLIYLMYSISERTKAKERTIDSTIKEIRNSKEFLTQLNSHLSRAISILLFIFLTSSINAIYSLHQVDSDANNTESHLVSVMGVLAAIQWLSILALPLIQAARVTKSCTSLKKTAVEVRSRPYSYKDTSQLDLDSLVIFTSGLNMKAKLISIPITPGLVAGVFFATGLALFLLFQYGSYSWAKWL